jgi:hypothetical protein
MEKAAAIEFFGSGAELARRLGLGRQAVSNWGEVIPEVYALRLERMTGGDLVYDESHYRSIEDGERSVPDVPVKRGR